MMSSRSKLYQGIIGGVFLLSLALLGAPSAFAQGDEGGDPSATDVAGAALTATTVVAGDALKNLAANPICLVNPTSPMCVGPAVAQVVGPALVEGGVRAVLAPVAAISWLIFMIAAQLLGLAGTIFNFAMQYLVFEFAQFFGNSAGMLLAWGVLRDIGNIILIFGFIFMGIATILDLHQFSARKALPRLIIFATLLNFSLFTAEAVIDTSNVLAATIYQQGFTSAAAEECENVKLSGIQGEVEAECEIEGGVSGSILTAARMTTVFQEDEDLMEGIESYLETPVPYVLKFIGLALITTTAAIVLLAGALMLIGRGVQLALLMVTSPIGFAGMAIPPLEKFARDWWHRLISQAFFAPVFLLLLLVALKIVEGLATLSGASGGLANAFNSNNAIDIGPVFFFILIMAFLIMALMSAKKFGVWGADVATNGAKTLVMGAAVGLPMGAAARISNFAVGKGANALRNSFNNPNTPQMNALARGILKPLETPNLDIRRIPGLGALGAPAKGLATFDEMNKAYKGVKDGTMMKKLVTEYEKEKKGKAVEDKHHRDEAFAKKIAANVLGGAGLAAAEKQFIAGQSAAEIAKNKALLTPEVAGAITPETFAQLMDKKSDALTDVEKERLANERNASLKAALAAATNNPNDPALQKALKSEVRSKTNAELDYIPADMWTPILAGAFSEKQREYATGSSRRSADERLIAKNSSPSMQFEINFNAAQQAGNAGVIAGLIARELQALRPDEASKLDEAILSNPAVAAALSSATLEALQKENKISNATIQAIGTNNPKAQRGPRAAFWR